MKGQCDGGVRNRHGEAHGHADHGAQFNVDVCFQHHFFRNLCLTNAEMETGFFWDFHDS